MMALGANWCNSARGFMFALGCIQSQSCHTDHCPTGVATQDPLRQKALVVPSKIERVHNYHRHTLEALKELVQAAGLQHPNQITANHVVRRVAGDKVKLLANHLEFIAAGLAAGGRARRVRLAAQRLQDLLADRARRQLRARGGGSQRPRGRCSRRPSRRRWDLAI